jgi:YHS domain-containing protein
MSVDPTSAAAHRVYEGVDVWFCATGCAERFDADPRRYLGTDEGFSAPTSVSIALGAKPSAHARGNKPAGGPSDGSARGS